MTLKNHESTLRKNDNVSIDVITNTRPELIQHYKNVVRIISHDIEFDYLMPFKSSHTTTSSGTGFFIDNKGHILTCSHCVENATHVYVEIPSEGDKKYEVKIKGVCPYFDIAVLQIINYKNNSFCELDNTTIIQPGFETYALGYPLGQENMKITKGIISGQQYKFYQTDAAINPGNSGGPLMYKNKVIGINAAGMPSWAADGIGYAVPISRYYNIKELLFSTKPTLISYPQYFGFEEFQRTSVDFQKYLKNKCKNGGVYVNKILEKSPVSKTKLKKGNIICKINDIEIDYYGGLKKKWMNENMSFENLLAEIGINKNVEITYWNGKNMKTDNFKLTKYQPNIRNMYPTFEKIDFETIAGLVVMNLNSNIINLLKNEKLNMYKETKNVMKNKLVITNILVGSYLAKLDILQPGDIISKINNKSIKSITDFRKYFFTNKEYIKIETEEDKMVIIPIKTIKQNEKHLIDTYKYNKSKLFKNVKTSR